MYIHNWPEHSKRSRWRRLVWRSWRWSVLACLCCCHQLLVNCVLRRLCSIDTCHCRPATARLAARATVSPSSGMSCCQSHGVAQQRHVLLPEPRCRPATACLAARATVSLTVTEHHCHFMAAKLCCLAKGAQVCLLCVQVCYMIALPPGLGMEQSSHMSDATSTARPVIDRIYIWLVVASMHAKLFLDIMQCCSDVIIHLLVIYLFV